MGLPVFDIALASIPVSSFNRDDGVRNPYVVGIDHGRGPIGWGSEADGAHGMVMVYRQFAIITLFT